MDLTESVSRVARSDGPRAARARQIARLIRQARGYRWVGVYEVSEAEIAVVAWSGGGAPAHPRFSLEEGLCGAAVASRRPVVVDDVAADPRYLTTFGSTRSELVVPVSDGERVVGLIDVESDRRGAFRSDDVAFIAACGSAARPLWQREADSITRAAPASASPDEQRPELAR